MTVIRHVSCPQRLPGETGKNSSTVLRELGTRTNGYMASASATSAIVGGERVDGGDRPTKRAKVSGVVLDAARGEPVRLWGANTDPESILMAWH